MTDRPEIIDDWDGDPENMPEILEQFVEESHWFRAAVKSVRKGERSWAQALSAAMMLQRSALDSSYGEA